ncbi:hypothetical protein O3P69_003398 [Scylla paramamosain]|uniref:Uncharacterized protein n=1 Tax=Scylla paramamosain TaxID=85552 RepID=A0AAW0UGJ5_SCYPA
MKTMKRSSLKTEASPSPTTPPSPAHAVQEPQTLATLQAGEVNRYITWPGQACAYKVGEIKIKELRQKAQNALGSLFRLSDFHDVLLGCIGPLKIVEECVASYIEQTNLEIEKGGEEKGEEEESEGGDKDEHESSDPREQGVDSESVASEDAAGGRSSVAGSSVLVLVACWLATLRAAHYR